MSAFGISLRIAVILAWLSVLGLHIMTYALPGFGINERRDLAATMAKQVDRRLVYTVQTSTAKLGECQLAFEREEAGFTLSTRIRLSGLPGMPTLPSMKLGNGLTSADSANGTNSTNSALEATAVQTFDDRLRLTGIQGEGEIFGMTATLAGVVDHRGFVGTVAMAGATRELLISEFTDTGNQGFGFAMSLPPGLAPGEQFRTTVMDVDLSMRPRQVVSVFSVSDREPIATPGGELPLLRVEMAKDGELSATLWCDDDGTVYRMALAKTDCTLNLMMIHSKTDGLIWPAPVQP